MTQPSTNLFPPLAGIDARAAALAANVRQPGAEVPKGAAVLAAVSGALLAVFVLVWFLWPAPAPVADAPYLPGFGLAVHAPGVAP